MPTRLPSNKPAWPAIFRRFWSAGAMDHEDIDALASLGWSRRVIEAKEPLNPRGNLCILASGMASRYRAAPDGGRQLTALLLPGDVCDFQFVTGALQTSGLSAMVRTTVMEIPLDALLPVVDQRPRILSTLLSHLAEDVAVTEELLISLGRRTALERMAHLLCETHFRLKRMGLVHDGAFIMTLTQAELGDYLGLSAVHVNRTMQELRRRGLIQSAGGQIRILDREALEAIAGFSPFYLRRSGVQDAPLRLDA